MTEISNETRIAQLEAQLALLTKLVGNNGDGHDELPDARVGAFTEAIQKNYDCVIAR